MKMKIVLSVVVCVFSLYSCLKSNDGCVTNYGSPSTTEVATLRSYITANGISAAEDPRGFFYKISFAGTGTDSPTAADSVTISYKGTLTSGTIFDSTATGTTRKFLLNDLITGWQLGLPLIKKGGVIDLYLPPSHGYGCEGQGSIPANAIIIFKIKLEDF
jgi:FKBP-type peptidyl-prolyl cis-trans isomerase FkpA